MTEPTTTLLPLRPARPIRRSRTGLILTALLLAANAAFAAPRFMNVRVTFYSPSAGSKTATGRSAHLSGLAVDPRVIPLGSRVSVPGFGVRIADDTGGAIKGRRIDVRLPVGRHARASARRHGVKHLRVRIVHPARHRDRDTARQRKAHHTRVTRHHKASVHLQKQKHKRKGREHKAEIIRSASHPARHAPR